MRFVKFEELKNGMRTAKPIYNKSGVLLYGVDTIVNENFIEKTKDLNFLGLYILEPAEPLPPMVEEEIEIEKFKLVTCHLLQAQLLAASKGEKFELEKLTDDVISHYGRLYGKITYIQSLRMNDDFVYKHSLSVAMLCAMICNKLKVERKEQQYIVTAAFLHDLGKIIAPSEILNKQTKLTAEELSIVRNAELEGFDKIKNNYSIPAGIRRYLTQMYMIKSNNLTSHQKFEVNNILLGTKIIKVADMFDILTAMRIYKEPMSEYSAINFFMEHEDEYDEKVVQALVDSINVLPAGSCVELSNGEKGLVIRENEYYILRPMVLGFDTNTIYDLGQRKVYDKIKIKDIMKTMDNRFIMDIERVKKSIADMKKI